MAKMSRDGRVGLNDWQGHLTLRLPPARKPVVHERGYNCRTYGHPEHQAKAKGCDANPAVAPGQFCGAGVHCRGSQKRFNFIDHLEEPNSGVKPRRRRCLCAPYTRLADLRVRQMAMPANIEITRLANSPDSHQRMLRS